MHDMLPTLQTPVPSRNGPSKRFWSRSCPTLRNLTEIFPGYLGPNLDVFFGRRIRTHSNWQKNYPRRGPGVALTIKFYAMHQLSRCPLILYSPIYDFPAGGYRYTAIGGRIVRGAGRVPREGSTGCETRGAAERERRDGTNPKPRKRNLKQPVSYGRSASVKWGAQRERRDGILHPNPKPETLTRHTPNPKICRRIV